MLVETYLGEIRFFAGDYAPQGWALCLGQLLAVTDFPDLFSIIGNSFGGDGRVNFALPDFRGRIPVGIGQNPKGKTLYTIGQMGGAETVTLSEANMPAHSHTASLSGGLSTWLATSGAGTSATPSNGALLGKSVATPSNITASAYITKSAAPPVTIGGPEATSVPDIATSTAAINNLQPNMMPTMAVTVIIATQGLYPPRSN